MYHTNNFELLIYNAIYLLYAYTVCMHTYYSMYIIYSIYLRDVNE